MDLNETKVFVKVVQAGSFNKAGKELGMPNSTVSAKVASLERRLGVTLLQRTTRKLNLTQAGETYFQKGLQALDEIAQAEQEVSSFQNEPSGTLRITAPTDMGKDPLVGLVSGLSKKFPKLKLEFIFTNRYVDLIAENIDVAIRAGKLKDSGLIARKLGEATWAPYASASYLNQSKPLNHPKDLKNHDCLAFTPLGDDQWKLSNGKTTVSLSVDCRIVGNDLSLMKALVTAGKGIALLPISLCQKEAQGGRLKRVLPDWHANQDPVHLVYPQQKFTAPKLKGFLEIAPDVLKTTFKD